MNPTPDENNPPVEHDQTAVALVLIRAELTAVWEVLESLADSVRWLDDRVDRLTKRLTG